MQVLILADRIETVPSRLTSTGKFVRNSYKVRPRLSQEFFLALTNWHFPFRVTLKRDAFPETMSRSVYRNHQLTESGAWGGKLLNISSRVEHLLSTLLPVSSLVPVATPSKSPPSICSLTHHKRIAEFTVSPRLRRSGGEELHSISYCEPVFHSFCFCAGKHVTPFSRECSLFHCLPLPRD